MSVVKLDCHLGQQFVELIMATAVTSDDVANGAGSLQELLAAMPDNAHRFSRGDSYAYLYAGAYLRPGFDGTRTGGPSRAQSWLD